MKTVYNNIIPFKGFKAITIFPFVFVRKSASFSDDDKRHECIHGEQQKETLIVLFYLWYGIEYLIKWAYYRNRHMAYKNVGFEREAYDNQRDIVYTDQRKHFAWLKYIAIRKSYYGKTH